MMNKKRKLNLLVQLNESSRNQIETLKNNKNIKVLEILQQQVNEGNKHSIENK